ncbi:sugar-binding transcriptional regulator [Rothia sp. ZJ932]|uniref:sugar-binding transcriptional regulator n=1 Tax=Rothia sp. ZJ932 TaxID=2810516 RepID=UPI0019674911|nr:sugar-binding domain-containing protein [Rothia sp. ZJ932]QRZ60962.1 transcriptional regulator [Rothia sp. ZJ932]
MHNRSQYIYEVADLYYMQGLTMETIAARYQVSRASISRLLKDARAEGIVRISLNAEFRPKDNLAQKIMDRYKVRAQVVSVNASASPITRMQKVARVAAEVFDSCIVEGSVAGIAWGSTVTEVAKYLKKRPLKDVTVVQLNGAGNAHHTGIPYSGTILGSVAETYGAQMIHFPVPAFFDFAATKQAMWCERSIAGVLAVQKTVDVALFGIGAFGGAIPSHVYNGGYFDADELKKMRAQGVVGDICTLLLREDGTYADLDINARATGPTPAELAKIPRRVCAASGDHRVKALRGALRTGAITDLVVDAQLAHLLLEV